MRRMPAITIPPQSSSPRRIALRSIRGSVKAVKSEMVAKAARATDTFARETDQKKQTQWAPWIIPRLVTASRRRRGITRSERLVAASQSAMANPAIETLQKTREGASTEMIRPRTAVRARMKTRK